jgi:hypothetical protein
MMGIHLKIALHIYRQIKQTMSCKAVEHMIKKSNARVDVCLSDSIQIDRNMNICLTGHPADIRFSLLHFSASLCPSRTLVENNYTLTLSIAQRYFSSNRTAIELA